MTDRYEPVGIIDESAADHVELPEGVIVDHPDDPDRCILAEPKGDD